MNLAELKNILSEQPGLKIRWRLPTGTKLPPHVHVTEVARMDKRFMDCGGTFRTESTCRLQTWFAEDTDHRLGTAKLLTILSRSASFLETDNLPVEVECEAPFVCQFPITSAEVEAGILVVQLGIKHTACLAEDKCLPPKPRTLRIFEGLPALSQTT